MSCVAYRLLLLLRHLRMGEHQTMNKGKDYEHAIGSALSLVSVTILVGGLRLFREAADLLLDAVPPHVDPDAVTGYLADKQGVAASGPLGSARSLT